MPHHDLQADIVHRLDRVESAYQQVRGTSAGEQISQAASNNVCVCVSYS